MSSAGLAVLGAGSWGTALAAHFAAAAEREGDVLLWGRDAEAVEFLVRERENRRYLPGVALPDRLRPTTDLSELAEVETAIVAIPSHGFRQALRSLIALREPSRPLVVISAAKGVETETTARMSEVAAEEAGGTIPSFGFAVLSGPTFAAELARDVPSAAVVASSDAELARRLRERLATPSFRIYSSTDVVGVELCGAAKNPIAVAAGVVSGLGLGHNTLAALITRGLHEITRLSMACGGQPETPRGLAGLGDLVLTCTGGLSRNRQTGMDLAAGKTLAEIEAESIMVAEGIRNSVSLTRLAEKLGIEMPIIEQMRRVLYDGVTPPEALRELMARERKAEHEL